MIQRTPHSGAQLAAWHRVFIYTAAAVLLLTGSVWLGLHYTVGAGAGELPHPLEAWAMRVHGLAAYAALFAFGIVTAAHLPNGWRASRRHRWAQQRATGLIVCALVLIVSFSGYLLYYFAPEWLRPSLGWTHAVAGAALTLGIVWHRRGARRRVPSQVGMT